MLKVEHLCKDYSIARTKLRVLDDVSLTIKDGEIVSIQGPSGAGKSTLLHLMGLLDTPTEGRVSCAGSDLARLSARRRAYWRNRLFGFVFQFYHLMADFTALENVVMPALVGLGAGQWGKARRHAMARGVELLGRVGLSARAGHRPSQLSGGERQRVAIARALINKPRMLLCDEPTGNLDSHTGEAVLDLLLKVREETGGALVLVTHDPKVAARARRQVRMVDGRIVSDSR
jgi:lipoprotein-releasing system ATP-binding protein